MGINIHVKVECELKTKEALIFELDQVLNMDICAAWVYVSVSLVYGHDVHDIAVRKISRWNVKANLRQKIKFFKLGSQS